MEIAAVGKTNCCLPSPGKFAFSRYGRMLSGQQVFRIDHITGALGSLPPLQKILDTGPVGCPVYLAAWLGVLLIFGADSLRKSLTGKGAL